ncbi:MAG TPA: hypothetical protein VI319_05995 [Burkholderiales bacterium]
MRNVTLSFLIVALAAVSACNRTADQTPASGPQAKAPSTPPPSGSTPPAEVNQPSSGATQPQAPSASTGTSHAAESPSKELSKQEESTGQPSPGTGGADHSTPAREPGAKG